MTEAAPDPKDLLQALGVGDVDGIESLPPSWGSSTVWRVLRRGVPSALRVMRPDTHALFDRELAAMARAGAAGIPVPETLATGVWEDRPVMLLAWCPGQPLLNELRRRPWRSAALGASLGRMQARIHALSAPPALREFGDAWLERAGPETGPLQSCVRQANRQVDALLHLDYHPLNVLTDGHRVSAVLDWTNTGAGDPRADLARTISLIRLTPAAPGLPPLVIDVFRRILLAAWSHGYAQQAGPVGDMAAYNAWAGVWMEREFAAKIGRPGVWLTEQDLAPIRRWSQNWAKQAGVADG